MLVVATKEKGKYGRYLGIVYAGGKDVNQLLINEGYAVDYFGGKR
jgi:endonuclease YncB( thermonuclease family)